MTTASSHTPGSQGTYSHRPIVWGTRGMVGGGTQLTAQSGMRILWQEGNAVDAAVASALSAGVMEPTAHYTLGGEVAFLFFDRASGKVRSVVGQGWAPQRATINRYLENWGEIPPGVLSTTVPGVISALLAMLSDYGTKSFAQVAESALHFAGNGFPAYQLFVRTVRTSERMANLRKYPDSARVFLPNDRPPELGSLFLQEDLARTLSLMVQAEEQALAGGGSREAGIQAARDVYYKGDVARRMVKALQDLGGLYDLADFADYESPMEEPISVTYRGHQVFTNRSWTQGISLLQALAILEGCDLAALGHNSPQAMHLQVEALKLAFADRERYVGDPAFVDVPFDGLLSREYAALRRTLIDPNKAQASYPAGDPRKMLAVDPTWAASPRSREPMAVGGDGDGTTYLATADSAGNLVSATPSSFGALAQGMVLGDTGILANCRGCYFWLDDDNPNSLAPRKRPRTTPCTFIILKDGEPFMTLGTPGGDSQPQSNLQTLCNVIDFGMNVQEAVEAPRFCGYSFPQSPWPHEEYPNLLEIEGRVSQDAVDSLNDKGHQVKVIGPWGVPNGFTPILVDPSDGVYHGGADPRKESVMLGW
ncbi:MAG: gamma-glutamyltransferase family protein [Chloroflexota bacterium]|nr:gamma-glutamyltransferase family protein [Chloroflexota bacterium]